MRKTPRPILQPEYWAERIRRANQAGKLHYSIFLTHEHVWKEIEDRHREILRATIGEHESVLDAGCGYGRLLNLMPAGWKGDYLGVDLSPDFIRMAKEQHPGRQFLQGDLQDLSSLEGYSFDWAVLISIRPMVLRELGLSVWKVMEANLKSVCQKILFLEYDKTDPGEVLA